MQGKILAPVSITCSLPFFEEVLFMKMHVLHNN